MRAQPTQPAGTRPVTSEGSRVALGRLPLPVLLSAAAALLAWLLAGPGALFRDTAFGFHWGQQLLEGSQPDYSNALAPTPHPLATALGGIASLLGARAGPTALIVLAFLCFGAIVAGVYELGRLCYSVWAGVLAAGVVATSLSLWKITVISAIDVVALALVVWAAVLEVRRPRRGLSVLALLAIAGLQRPEVWALAAAYWLYLAPALDWKRRLQAAAVVAVAPAVWGLGDVLVTNQTTHSLATTHATIAGAPEQGTVSHVLDSLGVASRQVLRLPALVGGVAGLLLAVTVGPARFRIPAAAVAVGVGSFAVIGLAGLPLNDRYILMPGVLLTIFFAFAVLGWWSRRRQWLGRVWALGAAALLAGLILTLPRHADGIRNIKTVAEIRREVVDGIRALAATPVAGKLLRTCGPIYVPYDDPVPYLSYELDRPLGDFAIGESVGPPGQHLPRRKRPRRARRGLILDAASPRLWRYILQRRRAKLPRGFRRVARNETWILYARRC